MIQRKAAEMPFHKPIRHDCPHARLVIGALWALACCSLPATKAHAGTGSTIRDAVDWVTRKFARSADTEAADVLAAKLTRLSSEHGDDAINAFRKVGPDALRYADEAGEHAARALGLMARHGEEGLWIVRDARRLGLTAKFGDDAATAMLRHRGIAEPVIEQFGAPAARLLSRVDPQQARRMAILTETGDLARTGRAQELLQVMEKHGDRAADFIWRHKGPLAIAATLGVFLANPEPFIDGTRDLASIAVAPVATAAGEGIRQVAATTHWTTVLVTALILAAGLIVYKWRRRAPGAS